MDDINFQASSVHNPSIQYVKIGNLGVGELALEKGTWRFHHWGAVTAKISTSDMLILMKAINQQITVLNITARLLRKR